MPSSRLSTVFKFSGTLLFLLLITLPSSFARTVPLNVRAKGNGTVYLTINGVTKSFYFGHNPSTTTWEMPQALPQYFNLDDEVDYSATVTSSGISDYVILLDANPNFAGSSYPETHELVLNGTSVDSLPKAEIGSSGIFAIRSASKRGVPFAKMDTTDFQFTRTIRFGLDKGGVRGSGGYVVFRLPGLYKYSSPKFDFYTGSNSGVIYEDSTRIQAYSDAGFVDVIKSSQDATIYFYKPEHGPSSLSLRTSPYGFNTQNNIAKYIVDHTTKTDPYVPSEVASAHPPATMNWTGARLCEITRTIGGETRVLEFRTDWIYGEHIEQYDEIRAKWEDSVTRVWPWRKTSATQGGLTQYWSSAFATENSVGPPNTDWVYVLLKVYKYAGNTNSSTLLEYASAGGDRIDSDLGLQQPPSEFARGTGSDKLDGPAKLRSHTSGWDYREINKWGGEIAFELYREASAIRSGNLGSESVLSVGKPKFRKQSFLDNDFDDSNALVTEYKYQSVLNNTKVVPISEITKQGSITNGVLSGTTIGKTTTIYQEFTFNGQQALTSTSTKYADSSATEITTTKRYSHRLSNTDYRDKLISVTRPDNTKTSYGIQRGSWTGTSWSASSQGDHLRLVTLNGATGSNVSSFKGITVDPLNMDAISTTLGRTTAEEKIVDSRGKVVFEAQYISAPSASFSLVSHKHHDYDDYGNLLKSYERTGSAANGAITRVLYEAAYSGHIKTSETDAQGVVTLFTYDNYDRLTQSKIQGYAGQPEIITSYTYDGMGRITAKNTGSSPNILTESFTFNTAGRLTSKTDASGMTTQISYPSQTETITTVPGGGTRSEKYYYDGRKKSTTGTAVPDTTYTYTYLSSGELESKTTLSTGQWHKEIGDWFGRVDRTLDPTKDGGTRYGYNYYNSKGQLYKQEFKNESGTHLLPRKLYLYDGWGRLAYAASDTNMNGSLETSVDRDAVRYGGHIQQLAGTDDWYVYEGTFAYVYEGSNAGQEKIVSQNWVQIGGFDNFGGSSNNFVLEDSFGYDADRNFITSDTVVNRSSRTRTTTSTVPGSGVDLIDSYTNGLLVSSRNNQNHTFTYTYDSAGRVTKEIDPRLGSGFPKEYKYLTNSARIDYIEETDGVKTYFGYYSSGRPYYEKRVAYGGSFNDQYTYFAWDTAGNNIAKWGNGTTPVKYVYNDLGQMTEMQTFRTEPTWNGSSFNITGDKTTWSYHSATGLMTSKKDAANRSTTFDYDDLGEVKTRTDARGVTTTYRYYDYGYYSSNQFTGQLRQKDYPSTVVGGATVTPDNSYTYHRSGGLKDVTDFTGTRSFDYFESWSSSSDTKGKSAFPKRENLPGFYYVDDVDFDYHFDDSSQLNGLRKSFKVLDSSTSVYDVNSYYSDKNRLSSVSPAHQNSQSFVYSYVGNSNLVDKVVRDNNGAYEYHRDYDYETDSNRLARVRTDWNNANVTDVMPRYDEFGRLFYTEVLGDVKTGLGGYSNGLMEVQLYTDRNEVDFSVKHQVTTASTYPNDNGVYGSIISKNGSEDGYRDYNYDAIGNRTLEDEHSSGSAGSQATITRNNLNQYTQYASKSYSYDNNGNLTSDGIRTFKYDAENQLTEVIPISPAVGDLKFLNKYDYLGRRGLKRVWEWNGSTWALRQDLTSRFLYDGWNLVAEIQDGGTVKKRYTWGNDISGSPQGAGGVGGLLMIELLQGSSYVQLYPIYDNRFNIIGLHNSSGTIVARYDYDTYGQLFKANGSSFSYNGDSNYAEANPFRFSTKYTDNYSTDFPNKTDGLVNYGLRYYDPDTGRFINRDPLQESGGLNLYGFVGNNPTNRIDYLGMSPYQIAVDDGTGNIRLVTIDDSFKDKLEGNSIGTLSQDDYNQLITGMDDEFDGAVLDPFNVQADYNDPGYLAWQHEQERLMEAQREESSGHWLFDEEPAWGDHGMNLLYTLTDHREWGDLDNWIPSRYRKSPAAFLEGVLDMSEASPTGGFGRIGAVSASTKGAFGGLSRFNKLRAATAKVKEQKATAEYIKKQSLWDRVVTSQPGQVVIEAGTMFTMAQEGLESSPPKGASNLGKLAFYTGKLLSLHERQ